MAKQDKGCVAAAAGPLTATSSNEDTAAGPTQEVPEMLARVGQIAPDFESIAYMPDKEVSAPVKLSDYKGKWITLCFYPGDFTFV